MRIALTKSAGSYRAGAKVNVPKHAAKMLIERGMAERIATGPTPKPRPKPAAAPAAPAENLNAMLKADLVTLASSYGITLDGNESKADIIHKIEVKRRYVRRDMQASG